MHDQIISRFAKFLNLMVLFCNFLLLLIYIISNLFRNFFAFTTACTRQDNCKMMPIRSVVKNSGKNLMSFIMIHCLKLRKRTDLYNQSYDITFAHIKFSKTVILSRFPSLNRILVHSI